MANAAVGRDELLRRALTLKGRAPTGNRADDEMALAGLLTDFRADLAGLRSLLAGVPDGDDVCERFALLAAAAGDGRNHERGTFDLYLVVRHPARCDRAGAEALLRSHFASMASVAREVGSDELAETLEAPVPIEWPEGPLEEHCTEVELLIYNELGDALSLSGLEHPLSVLREAAYTIAASYEIARFVLWPALRDAIETPDPYRSWVELWAHDVTFRHHGDRISAHLPWGDARA